MQRYLMNFDTKDLPAERCDCLVVGSGAAGLAAALAAAERGRKVVLVAKAGLMDSNSNKAQGGIAAAFGLDDKPQLHAADTFIAGAGLCQEEIVRLVVEAGPKAVKRLMGLGAKFDRSDDGQLALGREGCHSRRRILHARGDATGAEVVRSLLAAVLQHPGIETREETYVCDLLAEDGQCHGALVVQEGRMEVIWAGTVILATGGLGRLFQQTTNPEIATGSGLALAYRAGAELADMEFVQFHPTALSLEGCPNFLISEAVRGAGAVLRNRAGKRFMPAYHVMAELAPRDVVARAIYQEMGECKDQPVWLDATKIEAVEKRFPMIAATCREYGIDLKEAWLPIAPAAHYMMGGIRTDAAGRTNIGGLLACGETACTGLHGANRLASNSLLEALVFGRRAGETAAMIESTAGSGQRYRCDSLQSGKIPDRRLELKSLMSRCLGIVRRKEGLFEAGCCLDRWLGECDGRTAADTKTMEYCNMLLTARLVAAAAAQRCESRGAHYRLDYPQKSSAWERHIIEKRCADGI